MSAERRPTCTAHCAACGRHFSGDGAFDLHRRGEPDRRYCVELLEEPRLCVASEAAYCAISGEHDDGVPLTFDPVTVYGLAASRTPAERARLAALRGTVSAARLSVSQDARVEGDHRVTERV